MTFQSKKYLSSLKANLLVLKLPTLKQILVPTVTLQFLVNLSSATINLQDLKINHLSDLFRNLLLLETF